RRRHTRSKRDWSSDVCSSDLAGQSLGLEFVADLGEDVVVRALTCQVGITQGDVEEGVDAVEVGAGVSDERRPQLKGLLVAALEADDAGAGAGEIGRAHV